jgi:hypothetical protein
MTPAPERAIPVSPPKKELDSRQNYSQTTNFLEPFPEGLPCI